MLGDVVNAKQPGASLPMPQGERNGRVNSLRRGQVVREAGRAGCKALATQPAHHGKPKREKLLCSTYKRKVLFDCFAKAKARVQHDRPW